MNLGDAVAGLLAGIVKGVQDKVIVSEDDLISQVEAWARKCRNAQAEYEAAKRAADAAADAAAAKLPSGGASG